MPRAYKCRSTPFDSWPEIDREAWLRSRKPSSLPSVRSFHRRWKVITWDGVQTGYGFWLSWLEQAGPLEQVGCPAARAARDQLELYMEHMQSLGLADYTVAGRLADVGRALSVMCPQVDTAWIGRGASELHARAERAKDIREIVRPAAELADLGFNLMGSLEDESLKGGSYASLRFRDGLLIAFLIHCPLRKRNLTALELGVHLHKEEDVWRIDIPARETKTEVAVRCPWPPTLVDSLETYLAVHRRVLLGCGNRDVETDNLWVNRRGGPAGGAALYKAVCERTEVAFGRAINPHAFRHIAATDLATNSPEYATAIKDVLGHRSMDPSNKHYNQAKLEGAVRKMHDTYEEERRAMF